MVKKCTNCGKEYDPATVPENYGFWCKECVIENFKKVIENYKEIIVELNAEIENLGGCKVK